MLLSLAALLGLSARLGYGVRSAMNLEAEIDSEDDVDNLESLDMFEPSQSRYSYLVQRGCVRARAKQWDQLWHYTQSLTPPVYPNINRSKEEIVLTIWDEMDKISEHESHLKGYFVITRQIKRIRSSNRAKWQENIVALTDELQADGFDYDTAASRCAKGFTDEMYDCMIQKGLKIDQQTGELVQGRLAAEELLAHDYAIWHDPLSKKQQLSALKEARRQAIKKKGYSYTYTMKDCKKLVSESKSGAEYMEHAMRELSVGETDPATELCREKEGTMCPEGTAPTTQRRLDAYKGAKHASIAFVAAKAAFVVGFGVAGLFTGGLAAALGGVLVGFASPFAVPISGAVGFWSSIGPLECACFLRTCAYDDVTDMCEMQPDSLGLPSRNPYGLSLPYAGTTCSMVYKSNNTCSFQDCSYQDYAANLNDGDGSLQGTLGRHGQALHNCLSTEGGPGSSLSFVLTLPSGVDNTPEARNEIFRRHGVEEKRDPPYVPPSTTEEPH